MFHWRYIVFHLLLSVWACSADTPGRTQRPLVINFTSRSALLSWAPVFSDTLQSATGYIIQKRRHNPDGPWDVRSEIHVPSNLTTYNITALLPFTAYSFRTIAVAGNGLRGEPSQPSYPIITGREVPSGKPVVVRASTLGAHSIELTWRPPDLSMMNGEFIGHRLSFRPRYPDRLATDISGDSRKSGSGVRGKNSEDMSPPVWTVVDLPGNINSTISHVIDELQPFTEYVIRLQVKNMIGLGPYTVIGASTDEGAPGPPQQLRVQLVADSWTQLSWRAPRQPNGVIIGYYLYFSFSGVDNYAAIDKGASVDKTGPMATAGVDTRNFTDSRIVRQADDNMVYNLTGLAPSTAYTVWLFAKTQRHDGLRSKQVQFTTDVRPPSSPPRLTNVSCFNDSAAYVEWRRPTDASAASPLLYNVTYWRVEAMRPQSLLGAEWKRTGDFHSRLVESKAKQNTASLQLLMTSTSQAAARTTSTADTSDNSQGNWYRVRVTAAVQSLLNSSRLLFGPSSPAELLQLTTDCHAHRRRQRLMNADAAAAAAAGGGTDGAATAGATGGLWRLSAGMMAGVICAATAVLLTMTALLIWRKYLQANYNYLANSSGGECKQVPTDGSTAWQQDSPEWADYPLSVTTLAPHVARLHENHDTLLEREFEMIQQTGLDECHTADACQRAENKAKNRYVNVLAYDHTLVPLTTGAMSAASEGDGGNVPSDSYINANFIDGYCRPAAYIGTQGPLADTCGHFWRMVLEQGVSVIVAITNMVEAGRRKCEQYWPEKGVVTYEDVQVTCLGVDVMATYTIRRFSVVDLRMAKCSPVFGELPPARRIVYQYHYTNWPDHGIPDSALPVLSFVRKASAASAECGGPVVVHCSAGVGRTGTFIVLDAMLQMMRSTGSLNVFGFVRHIRRQRALLVQTSEQYAFVHDALRLAAAIGETDVHSALLRRYVHHLTATTQRHVYPWYSLDAHFQLLVSGEVSDEAVATARRPANCCKNRCQQLVPCDSSRVVISSRAGVPCSDYVNASWMAGFCRTREFIATQHPLPSTIADFWQMVWDHRATVVVLLSTCEDETFPEFWPVESAYIECEKFRVQLSSCSSTAAANCTVHNISISSHQSKEDQLSVYMVQCVDGWRLDCDLAGPSASVLVHTLDLVQRCRRQSPASPCVVVDADGGSSAAMFGCLLAAGQQLDYESHADVFLLARQWQLQRPGCWKHADQLLAVYRALLLLVLPDEQLPPTDTAAAAASAACRRHQHHAPPDVTCRTGSMPRPILKKTPASRATCSLGRRQYNSAATSMCQVRVPPDGMESCVLEMQCNAVANGGANGSDVVNA